MTLEVVDGTAVTIQLGPVSSAESDLAAAEQAVGVEATPGASVVWQDHPDRSSWPESREIPSIP